VFIGLTLGITFVISTFLSRWLVSAPKSLQILDQPNRRSLHEVPRQRTGGLAILASILSGGLFSAFGARSEAFALLSWDNLLICLGVLLIAAISFCDDRRGTPAAIRLVVHVLAATLPVLTGLRINEVPVPMVGVFKLGVLAVPATLLFIVWMANLFNFMDGMDGLAAGMAIWGFSALGAIVFFRGGFQLALLCGLVAVAAGGFLISNFPPALLFMGDVGSVPLGFIAGLVTLRAVQQGICDIWVPVLLFSPFIVDTTVVVLRRLTRGARVWEAHREHAYQKLVLSGWSHRQTLWAEYAMMTASVIGAGIYAGAAGGLVRLAVLVAAALAYTTVLIFVNHHSRLNMKPLHG